jgi:hypothetical protein
MYPIFGFQAAHKKEVVLALLFKQRSKIGTLMLLSPQRVRFRAAPLTGAYGLNFFWRRSV